MHPKRKMAKTGRKNLCLTRITNCPRSHVCVCVCECVYVSIVVVFNYMHYETLINKANEESQMCKAK